MRGGTRTLPGPPPRPAWPACAQLAGPAALTAALAVLAALAALAWGGFVGRVEVEGSSMEPTLSPGDRLLLRRSTTVRPGDVVAVADPRDPTRVMVKRVRAVTALGVDVRGDNPPASTDSRTFGPVSRRLLRGKVVYRYAPAERVGRLGTAR